MSTSAVTGNLGPSVPGSASARQISCARDFARDIDSACDLGSKLTAAMDRAVALDLESGCSTSTLGAPAAGYLARARHLARALDLDAARGDLAGVVAIAADLDPADTRQIADVLGLAAATAGQLAKHLDRARAAAKALQLNGIRAWALDINSDSSRDLDLGIDLAGAHASARALRRELKMTRRDLLDRARATHASCQREVKRVTPPAAGLLAAAARLLPAADGARYAEEYASELRELAQSGAGRLRQVLYALRQLRSSLPMSLTLRSLRRKNAAP